MVAADPPNTAKPVPKDDPADVAALKGLGIVLVPNENGNIIRVRDASFRTLDPTDWMPHLNGLPALWSVSFQRLRTTDANMPFLKDLTGLKELKVEESQITDAGLATWRACATLPR